MKLIESSVEVLEQESGLNGIYKQIELAGRTCYKSEDKITEDSAREFVDRMIKLGHGAMLEHGTVYLVIPIKELTEDRKYLTDIIPRFTKYSVRTWKNDQVAITTNLRTIVENGWQHYLKYIQKCDEQEPRITVKFTCDRGVSHEFVRHRVFSFAQESTRYCNYSKDKFGNELTFIIPSWMNIHEGEYKWEDQNPLLTAGMDVEEVGYDDSSNLFVKYDSNHYLECKRHYKDWEETEAFMHSLQISEEEYSHLIHKGWKPQQARAVLPNALKTELVMTGFATDWVHFFELRCAKNAHPDARKLALEALEKLYKLYPNYFEEVYDRYYRQEG